MLFKNIQLNKIIYSFLLIYLLFATTSVRAFVPLDTGGNFIAETVEAESSLSPSDELGDLLRRQADLLANSNELSTLRVQYAHAQLWYQYSDTEFVYWSQELKRRLLQLKKVNANSIATAIESLVYISVNFPGTVPCIYFRENSVECSIANMQSINNWLQKRNQQIFSATGATSWFVDWANRWKKTLQITDGYAELKQDMDQFLVDNPDLPVYFQLQQDFSTKSKELLADTGVAAKVNDYAQQYSSDLQAILNTTDYTKQLTHYNERSKTLLETNPDYVLLQQDSERLTKSHENLMQGIHSAIMNCIRRGYGNRCSDPQFNTFLKSSLPRYSVAANEILINSARLTEKYYQFQFTYSRNPEVRALQEETANKLKVTLEPVLLELQDAQETYVEHVFSIKMIREKLVELWDQLQEIGQQLGFIQS